MAGSSTAEVRISEGRTVLSAVGVELALDRPPAGRVDFTVPVSTPMRAGTRLTVEQFVSEKPWWLRWTGLSMRRRAFVGTFVVNSVRVGPFVMEVTAIDSASFAREMRNHAWQ